MPANTSPVFALTPRLVTTVVTGTTTDRTGATTANMKQLFTAGANGTKITQIGFKSIGNSSAGLILVWVTDNAGANIAIYDEIGVGAATPGTTTASARGVNFYTDFQLNAGQIMWVGATVVTSNIVVFAQIGDF